MKRFAMIFEGERGAHFCPVDAILSDLLHLLDCLERADEDMSIPFCPFSSSTHGKASLCSRKTPSRRPGRVARGCSTLGVLLAFTCGLRFSGGSTVIMM